VRQLWYVRRQGQISGPFPFAAIEQDFLLGRLQLHDELSEDRASWVRVAEQPEIAVIVTAEAAEPQDPENRNWNLERLAALRRWADQRTGADRREQGAHAPDSGRRHGERREPEAALRGPDASARSAPSVQPRGAWRLVAAILALVILILIAIAYHVGTVVPVPVRLG
jgi:hypothetical protein